MFVEAAQHAADLATFALPDICLASVDIGEVRSVAAPQLGFFERPECHDDIAPELGVGGQLAA